jgi:predicted membrane channel-forming protein YqfA (hemolysin III family)
VVSAHIAIASAMVFLTLVLKPTLARWTNIILPVLYAVSIVASVIGEEWPYFWFLSIAEVVVLLGIVWYAWMWPRNEADR